MSNRVLEKTERPLAGGAKYSRGAGSSASIKRPCDSERFHSVNLFASVEYIIQLFISIKDYQTQIVKVVEHKSFTSSAQVLLDGIKQTLYQQHECCFSIGPLQFAAYCPLGSTHEHHQEAERSSNILRSAHSVWLGSLQFKHTPNGLFCS